jgi:hypothetical protein
LIDAADALLAENAEVDEEGSVSGIDIPVV